MSENRIREYDFCTREFIGFTGKEKITFKQGDKLDLIYEKESYDWYIVVAIEKCDLIKEDRHLITRELVLSYRWAIREGYNHMLDRNLQNAFDRPRNRNTVKGVKAYTEKIEKLSKE